MVERLLCIDTLLTLEMLKAMPPKTVFAVGKTVNSPEGVYMTDACFGRELAFVAERGQIHDWAIYIGWADMDLKWIEESGVLSGAKQKMDHRH